MRAQSTVFFLVFGLLSTGCADGGGMGTLDSATLDSGQPDTPGLDVLGVDVGPGVDAGPGIDGGSDVGPGDDVGPGVDGGPDGGPDAGPPDVGVDAGPFDAGNDAGPPPDVGVDAGPFDAGCSGDPSCDNGNPCDGAERCVAGSCQAGTPVVCDDGITCTVDTCVPATGLCQSTPNNGMCAAPQICTATGCTAPGCGESPCRLVSPQCGCPTGQACYITGMDTRVCALEGTSDTGESCNGGEICSAGNVCIDLDGMGATTMCRAFCDTDADCPAGAGALCLVTVVGTTQQICTTHCNPASNAGCPANTGCSLFTDMSGRRLTDCDITGAGTQGNTCVDRADCDTGFDCFDVGGGTLECLRTCTRGGALPPGNECDAFAGTTCVRLGAAPGLVFDGTEYGACI